MVSMGTLYTNAFMFLTRSRVECGCRTVREQILAPRYDVMTPFSIFSRFFPHSRIIFCNDSFTQFSNFPRRNCSILTHRPQLIRERTFDFTP